MNNDNIEYLVATNNKNSITYLLHGFNVRDGGDHSTGRLLPYLRAKAVGHVMPIRYGWFGLLSVIFKNKKVAKKVVNSEKRLMNYSKNGAFYGVGHSNGCAILVEAARQGAKFECLYLINPALKVDTVFPASIKRVIVIHTKHDVPTRAARMLDRVPLLQLIVPNAWGAMGARGYKGGDERVTNLDLSGILDGHSDIFQHDILKVLGPAIAEGLYEKGA